MLVLVLLSVPSPSVASQEAPLLAHEAERILAGPDFGAPDAMHVQGDGRLVASMAGRRAFYIVDPATGSLEVVTVGDIAPSPIPRMFGWVGDTLWASDWFSSHLVRLDGERVATEEEVYLPGRIRGVRGQRLIGVLPGGKLLVQTSASLQDMAVASGSVAGGTADHRLLATADSVGELPIWIADMRGKVVDTLAVVSTRNRSAVYLHPGGQRSGRTAMIVRGQPFGDFPLFALDPTNSQLIIAERWVEDADASSTYTVHWVDMRGDTIMSKRYSYDPVPIPTSEVTRELQVVGADLSDDSAAGLAIAREALYVPDRLPPVSHVVVGSEGWVWVGRSSLPGGRRWDILDPAGERIGAVLLPSSLWVRAVQGLTSWATEERGGGDGVDLWRVQALPL